MSDRHDFESDRDLGVAFKSRDEVQEPKMYRVILHNDDYTTMEFVIAVLVDIFHKTIDQANKIMLDVHKKGKGIVGVYTYDIALTRMNQVNSAAKENEFPLKCTIESV